MRCGFKRPLPPCAAGEGVLGRSAASELLHPPDKLAGAAGPPVGFGSCCEDAFTCHTKWRGSRSQRTAGLAVARWLDGDCGVV